MHSPSTSAGSACRSLTSCSADRPAAAALRRSQGGARRPPEDMEDATLVSDAPAERRIRAVIELREALGSDVVVHFALDAPPAITDDVRELAVDVGHEALEKLEGSGDRTTVVARLNPRTTAKAGGHDRAGGRHPPPALLRPGHRVGDLRLATRARERKHMRKRWLLAPVVALGLLATACGSDDDESGGATTTAGGATTTAAARRRDDDRRARPTTTAGSHAPRASRSAPKPNTGKVTLLSAGEPSETDAYQTIFDDLINAKTDYKARSCPAATSSSSSRSRPQGGTLDVAAAPQPGSIPALVDKGAIVALEDLGFNIDELNDARRRVVRGARRVQGQALRRADQHQPQEHGLVPEEGVRRQGLHRAEDVGRAHGPQRQDQGRRRHAVVRRLRQRGIDGLAGDGLDGGHHAPHRGARGLRQVGASTRSPSTTRRCKKAGEIFGKVMFADGYVLGGAANTPDIAVRRRAGTDVRRTRRSAGCTGRRTSSPPSSRRTRRPASTTTGSPSRRSTRRAPSTAVSSPSSARTATAPRSSTS